MNILNYNTKKLYFRFLAFSFGSALISSLYSVVDMAMVGQYHGANGSAAMAVVAPLWNIIYSLGLLTGMGGAILWAKAKGEGKTEHERNEIFSVSMMLTGIISLILWIIVLCFERQILVLFGATESLIDLAESYLISVKYTIPIFLFNQALAAFLRNDNDPGLATVGIVLGGIFNVAGDYLLVFTANMGIEGAGIATVGCNVVSLLIMLTHFLKKKNTLKIVKAKNIGYKSTRILLNGFSSFFTDTSMGIFTIIFNRQILNYFNEDALSVYGVIININTFVQCCSYGVGQASQPLLSENYGAKQYNRVKQILKYSLLTILVISIVWLIPTMTAPNGFINLFMKPNDNVLKIAPSIMRAYCLAFIFLPYNVFSTYFFQSLTHPKFSLLVSALRGLIISVPLLFILPSINPSFIWYTMFISEGIISIIVLIYMIKIVKELSQNNVYLQKKTS
ncbi:MAG: MATE family efflux transporter [Bacilli bacterium]